MAETVDCILFFVIGDERYVLGQAKCEAVGHDDFNISIERTLTSEPIRTAGVGEIIVEIEGGRRMALGSLEVVKAGDTIALNVNN